MPSQAAPFAMLSALTKQPKHMAARASFMLRTHRATLTPVARGCQDPSTCYIGASLLGKRYIIYVCRLLQHCGMKCRMEDATFANNQESLDTSLQLVTSPLFTSGSNLPSCLHTYKTKPHTTTAAAAAAGANRSVAPFVDSKGTHLYSLRSSGFTQALYH